MDECATVFLGFPPDGRLLDNEKYDKEIKSHIQRISRLLKDEGAVVSANAGQLLSHLDPTANSVSYLVLLLALFDNSSKSPLIPETCRVRAVSFLLTFDPRQIRYAGVQFSNLLTLIESGDVFPAEIAVDLLTTALLKLDPSGTMFTSHHLPIVKLAYSTNHIETVLRLINKDIMVYPIGKASSDSRRLCDMQLSPISYMHLESGFTERITPSMVLEYNILCAQCHLAVRDWQAASEALERVLTSPTKDQGCSKIMADAYNKWILVGLLYKGKAPPTSTLIGVGAQRVFSITSRPYLTVAEAFEKGEGGAAALKAEVEGPSSTFWPEDGNTGLIGEVLNHYQRWQIINLRNLYWKISLEEIRRQTQSALTGVELEDASQVEALVEEMIRSSMFHGAIEKPEGTIGGDGQGYLTFLPSEGEKSEGRLAQDFAATSKRLKELDSLLKAVNDRLGMNRDFIKHLIKQERLEIDNARDPGVEFDSQIEDEDLMTGIIKNHLVGFQ